MAITPGNTVPSHGPEERVESSRLLTEKVPRRVVRAGSLGHLAVRLGLNGVDQVRELDGGLDEEDRDVVSDDVEVALVGVEANGEAVDITDGIGTTSRAGDGREADEEGGLLALLGEERRASDVGIVAIAGEGAVSTSTAGMDSSFRDLYSSATY